MNTLDDRLSRAFRAVDVPADFETRLLARVHALSKDGMQSQEERANSARRRAQESLERGGRELRLWHRAAFRMLTLDSVAGLTLIIVLLLALPRLAPQLGILGPTLVVAALGVVISLFYSLSPSFPSPLSRGEGKGEGI
jgi:hypothetical protein